MTRIPVETLLAVAQTYPIRLELSQTEIDGDNPCSRHLSERIAKKEAGCTIVRISQLKEKVWRRVVS